MKCSEKKLSENQINDENSHFSRDIVWWKIRLYEFLNPMTPCCVLLLFFNKLETMTQALLWWEKKDFTGCLQAKFEEGKIIGILGGDFIASNNANFQQLWQITVCSKSDNSTTYALFWSYAAEKILCCHICSKQKDFFSSDDTKRRCSDVCYTLMHLHCKSPLLPEELHSRCTHQQAAAV